MIFSVHSCSCKRCTMIKLSGVDWVLKIWEYFQVNWNNLKPKFRRFFHTLSRVCFSHLFCHYHLFLKEFFLKNLAIKTLQPFEFTLCCCFMLQQKHFYKLLKLSCYCFNHGFSFEYLHRISGWWKHVRIDMLDKQYWTKSVENCRERCKSNMKNEEETVWFHFAKGKIKNEIDLKLKIKTNNTVQVLMHFKVYWI